MTATRRGRRAAGERVVMLGSGSNADRDYSALEASGASRRPDKPLQGTMSDSGRSQRRKALPASVQAAIDAAEREETRPRVTMVLTLPFPPSVNNLYATVMTRKGKMRRATSEQGKDYRETVIWAVRHWVAQTRCLPPCPPFRLTVVAYPPRDGQRHDLTNLFKCPEDALMKAIGEDDDDVLEVHAVKGERSSNPRIEVTLQHAPSAAAGDEDGMEGGGG